MKRMMNRLGAAARENGVGPQARSLLTSFGEPPDHQKFGHKKTCYVLLMFSHHQHVRRPKQY